ncbi:MAG: hypothetical protein HY903_19040 [Deltaproteobacteria bacterium]|nr:hypothetical protein [Deltaproteobacteria bacterium]
MSEPPTSFDAFWASWSWRPIPGCPGRYTIPKARLSPPQLVGAALPVERHRSARAKHPVLVVRFPAGGGLISYEHEDGYVHTLNTPEGLARKLASLGIDVSPTTSGPGKR